MSKGLYQAIALLGLVPIGLATWWSGGGFADWLATEVDPEWPTMLRVVGYLLTALGWLLLWAVLLLPWRRRVFASDEPVQGAKLGLVDAFRQEQARLEAAKQSSDPGVRRNHHGLMMMVSGVCSVVFIGLSVALFLDGYVSGLLAGAAAVAPGICAYHALKWLSWRSRG
jgi:hypothetical protein